MVLLGEARMSGYTWLQEKALAELRGRHAPVLSGFASWCDKVASTFDLQGRALQNVSTSQVHATSPSATSGQCEVSALRPAEVPPDSSTLLAPSTQEGAAAPAHNWRRHPLESLYIRASTATGQSKRFCGQVQYNASQLLLVKYCQIAASYTPTVE